jgi:hypothetical protein
MSLDMSLEMSGSCRRGGSRCGGGWELGSCSILAGGWSRCSARRPATSGTYAPKPASTLLSSARSASSCRRSTVQELLQRSATLLVELLVFAVRATYLSYLRGWSDLDVLGRKRHVLVLALRPMSYPSGN